MSDSMLSHGRYSPWNPPGTNTRVRSLSLLRTVFPTQRSNPGLLALQADSLAAEPQGKPKNPYPFSSTSSQPIELGSTALQVDSLPTELSSKPPKCS